MCTDMCAGQISCPNLGSGEIQGRDPERGHMMCWCHREGLSERGKGLGLRNIPDSGRLLEVNRVNISP